MIIDGLSWHQFSNLPHIASLPLNRQLIEYEIYNQNLIHEVMLIQQQQQLLYPNTPSAAGAGGRPEPIVDELPSNAFEYVVDTTNSDNADFEVTVSADTNVTVTWGDGQTEEMLVTSGASPFQFDHIYDVSGAGISYTIRVTFDNIENVTELEFYS